MDHGFSIEEIHDMLDAVERSLTRLRTANLFSKQMPVTFISDAVSVVYDLDQAGVLGATGISRTLALKLKNLDGTMAANVMTASLERVRTYLRKIESEHGGEITTTSDDRRIAELDAMVERNPPPAISVLSDAWVYVPPNSRVKQIIVQLSDLLEDVHLLAKTTNLPEQDAAISDLERAQLIALLETTLAVLKAPMVERGLLKKLQSSLADAGKKAAEKQVEQGMASAIDVVLPFLRDLFKSMWGG
jgi:hypothetical protein